MDMDMEKSHEEKYEDLAQRIGIEQLKEILKRQGLTKIRIQEALQKGDEHLNSISLGIWNKMAGVYYISYGKNKFFLTWSDPFNKQKANGLSLADRVCILKHVARNHL